MYLKNVTFDEAAPFHTRQEMEQVVNAGINKRDARSYFVYCDIKISYKTFCNRFSVIRI